MSFWSAIGLADKKMVQELREENHQLIEEKYGLLDKLLQEHFKQEEMAQKVLANTILKGLEVKKASDEKQYQEFTEMLIKLLCGQNQIRTDVNYQGEVSQKKIAETGENVTYSYQKLKAGMDKLGMGIREEGAAVRNAVEQLEGATQTGTEEIISRLEALRQGQGVQADSTREAVLRVMDLLTAKYQEISLLLEHLKQQQITAIDAVCVQCNNAVKEFQATREHYNTLIHSEDKWVDELDRLSGGFQMLSQEQVKVMGQLAQLCQDSDQFLEIQKSVNDMWEIMKVVWVDSLLEEYGKKLK